MRKFIRTCVVSTVALLLNVVAIESAHAHVIDRIEIKQAGDEAEIQIIFDTRIQFVRDVSVGSGEVHLYFNLLEPDPSANSPVSESKESPPSEIAPHFTVSYPELDSALDIKFDNQIEYRVRPGNDGRSISVFVPAIKPKTEAVAAQSELPTQEAIELKALQLLTSARDALAQGQLGASIETLNQLLDLPPNKQSQPAQELIGEAREKNGEFDKARVEYALYLKLYPDAADAAQVAARLARLPKEAGKQAERPAQQKNAEEKMMVYGSFSQNYYKGFLHSEATNTVSGAQPQPWSGVDQSTLISSLDLIARKRTETTDTRFVLRDDFFANFMAGQANNNQLSDAYVEQSSRDQGYLYRVGRQTGTSGGVLGRFDGALFGYSLDSAWRVNVVAGSPVDFYNSYTDRKTFTGMSVDLTRLPDQWNGSAYLIQQRAGGVTDRQAVGMEARYFDMQSNYMGLLDYDTQFKAVNFATLQGNWTMPSGTNYNLLIDHRKSPPLQLSNALPGETSQSIASLLQSGVSTATLLADAKTLTPTANLFMIGTTQPFSAHWRVGGDFRVSNLSGTGGVGPIDPLTGLQQVQATQGSGNVYMYTVQAIGNDLITRNDMNMVSASYISAASYKGRALGLNRVDALQPDWRMDLSLQYYVQNGIQNGLVNDTTYRQARITPSIKLNYQMNGAVSLECEAGIEDTRTSGVTSNDTSRRRYIYAGYRWDFQ